MYTPKHFLVDDKAELLAFMQQYSFALLISTHNNCPTATHLPFIVQQTADDNIVLTAHFAKANPQWQQITQQKVLVVFSQPHAYISPKHYDNTISVPTWNYIAVHAYGHAQIIDQPVQVLSILEQTIQYYESDYLAQWHSLPNDYKHSMIQGIVAFNIQIDQLQASYKLSQNKNEGEKQRIMHTLSNSPHSHEKDIADYMRSLV